MDKRQLRQSAMADFMESLEQLNELWGNEAELAHWNEGTKVADIDQADCSFRGIAAKPPISKDSHLETDA
ncbi:MAG: hypothetical protein F6K31_01285 [Symploca sp. SIO2G7]|nr:hypothetical protein [Symploca sp. SIO2G7]